MRNTTNHEENNSSGIVLVYDMENTEVWNEKKGREGLCLYTDTDRLRLALVFISRFFFRKS